MQFYFLFAPMQTIDLATGQQVNITYELAAVGERILAFIIDLVVVGGGILLLFFLASVAYPSDLDDSSLVFVGVMGFVLIATFILYNFLFELLSHGQSLGKKAMAIQVVRLDGEPPAPADYLLRAILHFVDTLLSGGIIGLLLIGSTRQRQRIGDMTAGTTVIKMRASEQFRLGDILRISTIEDYEPKYLGVRQFSEQDMLLIKNTLARAQTYSNATHQHIVEELAVKVADQLGEQKPSQQTAVEFLRTLIRDYIVLTR